MKGKCFFLAVLCFCFVLLFDITGAQESKQSALPQRDPIFIKPSPGWKVVEQDTLGAYSFVEAIRPPKAGAEPHRHSREDEAFYILEGELEFRVGKQIFVATPGSFLFAPRGIPHSFKNVGTTPARFLTIISPGGLERFFRERSALDKELPTSDPSNRAKLKEIQDKYGMEFSNDWSFPPKTGN